jgi:hypothetical protein
MIDFSRLLSGLRRCNRHEGTPAPGGAETYLTADGRKDRVIAAHTDAASRMHGGAALAHQNISGNDRFATKFLQAKAPTGRIPAIARRTACLLMCHGSFPSFYFFFGLALLLDFEAAA